MTVWAPALTDQRVGQVSTRQVARAREGPYATAAAACLACGAEVGTLLVWTRTTLNWVADWHGLEYRVPADPGQSV